jgi:hypothetical protein
MLFESQVVAAELPALTSAPTASTMPRPRQARRIENAPSALRMNDVNIGACLPYSLVVIPTANVFWINNGDEYDLRSIQTLPDTAYSALTEHKLGSLGCDASIRWTIQGYAITSSRNIVLKYTPASLSFQQYRRGISQQPRQGLHFYQGDLARSVPRRWHGWRCASDRYIRECHASGVGTFTKDCGRFRIAVLSVKKCPNPLGHRFTESQASRRTQWRYIGSHSPRFYDTKRTFAGILS